LLDSIVNLVSSSAAPCTACIACTIDCTTEDRGSQHYWCSPCPEDAAARRYPASAYYAAKLLASLPFNVAIALSFILTVYGMVGLRKDLWAGLEVATIAVLMSLISMQVSGGGGLGGCSLPSLHCTAG
jgi:hypothetical protein